MTTKTTDLVYAGASLRERQDYALALSKAGDLIPRGLRDPNGQPNAGKILLVTEYGNALGIHPIVAINGIDIIEGNLTITPALMSGLVREAGHKLRIHTDGTGQGLTATAELVRADDPQHPYTVTWTMQDAKAAGLEGKSNWKKYPRAMLKARAISEVCREGAEDVLMGAHYTAEEMGATVNEAGEVIEYAEIVEQDHDGPAVQATMRETTIPNRNRAHNKKSGHATETEVPPRPETERTAPEASGTGRSRPQKPTGPATTDTRDRATVALEWFDRITATDDLDALIRLHHDAVKVGVLDHTRNGHTVEEAFLNRRAQLQQAQAGEPDPSEDDVPLDIDDDLEELPF